MRRILGGPAGEAMAVLRFACFIDSQRWETLHEWHCFPQRS